MVDLGDLAPDEAERIAFAMQHVETTGPLGYHVLAELLPFLRRGVKAGCRSRSASTPAPTPSPPALPRPAPAGSAPGAAS